MSITEGDLREVWVSEGSYAVDSSGLYITESNGRNMMWFSELYGFTRCTNTEGGCVLDRNGLYRILFIYPSNNAGTGTLDGGLTIRGFDFIRDYSCGGGL